jgi:hypothetical protein
MNKLVEQLIKELRLQIFNEEDMGDKTIIAIYPGRFQPMGRHHKTAYDWLAKQFGKDKTYVVTSDKVDPARSPLNFQEKKEIINKSGIQNVVQVRRPYDISEFLTTMNLDPKNTVLVYMVGEKDVDRLKHLKRMMAYNKTTALPVKDLQDPYAYYVISPHISLNIPGIGEMSGTTIRQALSDNDAKLAELKERFKSIMGWFDAKSFNLLISKFNTKRGKLKEDLNEWMRVLLNMTDVQGEMFFSILKKEYGDTKDLLPLIQKYIKTKSLTDEEKAKFQKQMKDTFKLMGLGAIAAIPIPGTMLMIPIIIQAAKKFNINLLPEADEPQGERLSIVRREFWNEVFTEVAKEETQLINEGGAAGHMAHPFEDFDLTFGDMKEMFRLGLSGEITVKGNATEKLDGMNLYVTYRGGNVYVARKTTDIRTGGMDYEKLKERYTGYDLVQEAFLFAFTDLEKAFRALPQQSIDKIFGGGNVWLNLEVIYPKKANIINYDGAHIVFHNVSKYDEMGNKVEDYSDYAGKLSDIIQQVNAHTQETFSIEKPKALEIGRSTQFDQRLQYFTTKITTLQDEMGCSDSDTVGVWHQRWWEKYIKKNATESNLIVDKPIMDGLVKRWAFGDKSFGLNSKNIPDKGLLTWAKNIDKLEVKQQMVKNIKPFEELILEFGAEVLKNAKNFMALNPTETTNRIKSSLQTAIQKLKQSTDIRDLDVLKKQLKRLDGAGGVDAIVPLEGVVFTYNGKTYKLTGTFAPINQLMSYLSKKS